MPGLQWTLGSIRIIAGCWDVHRTNYHALQIVYSEWLALEGQQEFNTWRYSPKFSPKVIFAVFGLRWFISPLHTVINWKWKVFNIINLATETDIDAISVAIPMFWGKVCTGVYVNFARHFHPQKFQDGRRIPEVVITLRQKMIPRWSQRLWQCFRARPIHLHQHLDCVDICFHS